MRLDHLLPKGLVQLNPPGEDWSGGGA